MTKKLLLDFENGIAVVFFQHQERTYTSAFSNKHDLWAFLEKAPQAIRAGLASSEARAKMHALRSIHKISCEEASQILASMPEAQVRFISQLGAKNYAPRVTGNFDPSKLEF